MKVFKNLLICCVLALSLTACDSGNVVKETSIIETPVLKPNLPEALSLSNVDWNINTDGAEPLFTLTKEQYNNLAGNLVEMQRYIKQLKQTVKYYQSKTAATTTAKPVVKK